MASILIVEDERKTAEIVELYLRRDGHEVRIEVDGSVAWRTFSESPAGRVFDLVILDWMLPGLDGPTLCRRMRSAQADLKILMLTARAAEDDRIQGLDLGADDYVCKPFSPRELAARVRALLRRSAGRSDPPAEVLRWQGLVYDFAGRRVTVDGRELALTRTEGDLLACLLASPGRVFSRAELIAKTLGDDYEGLDRTIDAHIGNLRRKLTAADPRLQPVETVFGVGYRLADESEEAAASERAAPDV